MDSAQHSEDSRRLETIRVTEESERRPLDRLAEEPSNDDRDRDNCGELGSHAAHCEV